MRKAWLWGGILLLGGCNNDGSLSFGANATPSATATAVTIPTATITAVVDFTSTATPTPTSTVTSTPEPQGAVALFSDDPFDIGNPFPSDRLLDENGHLQISFDMINPGLPPDPAYDQARAYLQAVSEQLSDLTGFSTYAPIRVLFDGPVATPEEPLPILVLRLDDPSVMHPIEAEAVTPDFARDYAFEIYPLLPLEAKTRYVYVVTVDALDANGHHIRPDPDLTARVTSTAPDAWRESLEPVLEHLSEELGIDRSEIAAIDFFTTQPTTDDLIAIRDLFDDGVLPVAEPAFENSPVFGLNTGVFPEGSPEFTTLVGSETSDYVAAVAVGSFPSFDFRFGSQRPFDPARVSAETMPTVNHLDFYMTIPKAPPPAGGYPITIFGHGLGGSGQNAIRMAEFTRDEPMMWIGISAVEHGRRGQVANFFNLANGFATREHFRQTIADFLQLQRMIRNATVSPFDLVDKNRIHYAGVSLGGIMGTLYMGVEPDVAVGMLSVPGGGLPRIINSVAIGDLIKPLLSLVSGVPLNDPLFPILFHGFQQVSQLVIDPADPINTAPFVIDPEKRLPRVPPKRILMHEGIVDDVVPNETTEALAAAMGLPDVKATLGCLDSAGCSGIWRFVMTEYGEEEDSGHGVTGILEEAMQQLARFLLSDGTEIIDASPRE